MRTPIQDPLTHEIASFPAAKEAQVTLTVAVYPSLDLTILRTIGRWKLLHPEAAVQVVSREMNDHHRAMADLLANGVNVPDVIGLEATYMSRFAALGGLEDLSQSPYHAEACAARMARYALPAARGATGALLALPADIGPAVLFYREDLLDRAGVAEADLASWEGFVEAGRRLRAETGVALLAHVAELADLRARAAIPPGEGLHFDAGGVPRLRGERFVVAFELARAARAAGVDVGLDEGWTPGWASLFSAGRVASQPAGSWLMGMLEEWIAPQTRGLWRTTDLPGRVHAGWGGSYYALTKRSPHLALGWDFLKLMCLDRHAQLGALEHSCSFPASLDALDDPFLDEPLPFLGGQRARQHWRSVAAQIPVLPVHPLDTLAAGALRTALHAVLDHGQEIGLALAEAERRVWRLVKEAL
jgi:multiple sugar transport system substrate-binding protein